MNRKQITISYDEFKPKSFEEQHKILREISAENRALLMRTHIERWLKINRGRLTDEQISVAEEAIAFITPDKYEKDRDNEKVEREMMALEKKVFAAFSQEDAQQMMSPRSAYILDNDEEKI